MILGYYVQLGLYEEWVEQGIQNGNQPVLSYSHLNSTVKGLPRIVWVLERF